MSSQIKINLNLKFQFIMLFDSQIRDLKQHLPWEQINYAKSQLRGLDEQKRRILTPEQVKEESHKIVARIESMRHFQDAKVVMLYYPIQNEVDLRSLVSKYDGEKTFLLPATLADHKMEVRIVHRDTELKKGRYGVPEPPAEAYKGKIDLILVPGVAFDKNLYRLGRGGGYYDRFLRRYRRSFKVGVCYSSQLHENIPHSWHDIRMNHVVSPDQII